MRPDQETCPRCAQGTADLATTIPASPPGRRRPGEDQPIIGDFQIIREIGRGGMGTVYEAYQESMHRKVALKILDASAVPSRKEAIRFEREAWIGGRLSHPNVIKVYGHGVEGRSHYIAMELAGGESLHDLIGRAKERRKNARSDSAWRAEHIRSMVKLFIGVADALEHVHESSVVHRDIKPANLLLSTDGSRLMITDFGLARDEESSLITRKGDLLGTIRYMSPEQLLASRVRITTKSDIWSLGMSLYESLTLKLPFSADSEEAYISALSMKEPSPARAQDAAVPRDLETILMKCLERDPDRRYSSARALSDDLTCFLEDRPVLARRPSAITRVARFARHHRAVLGASIAVAIVAAVAVNLLADRAQRRRDISRVTSTLEQVIAERILPSSVHPDWPDLQEVLREAVAGDPDGPLANLALRASANVRVTTEPFGLVSELPQIELGIPARSFDPALEYFYIADLDWAWDGASWEPVASAIAYHGGPGGGYSVPLGTLIDKDRISPGPHRAELRARIAFYDPAIVPIDSLPLRSTQSLSWSPTDNPWDSIRDEDPLFTEVRELEPLTIHVFQEYPADFPHAINGSQAISELGTWFAVDRVELLRLVPPEGDGSVLEVSVPSPYRPGEEETWTWEITSDDRKNLGDGLIVRLRFHGYFEFDQDPSPPPIAAEASLQIEGRSTPLCFPLTCGQGRFTVPHGSPSSYYSTPSVTLYWASQYGLHGGDHLRWPPEVCADGEHTAQLVLTPSRSLALGTRAFDRYLGEEISIPITLEVLTVRAKWADTPEPS